MRKCKDCFYFEEGAAGANGNCNAEPDNVQAITVPNPLAGSFEIKLAVLRREVSPQRHQCRHFITPAEKYNE